LVLSALQHSITPSLRVANFPPGSGCLSLCSAHTGLANSVAGTAIKRRTILPLPALPEGEYVFSVFAGQANEARTLVRRKIRRRRGLEISKRGSALPEFLRDKSRAPGELSVGAFPGNREGCGHGKGNCGRHGASSVVARASRLCESCNQRTGETPVPLPSEHQTPLPTLPENREGRGDRKFLGLSTRQARELLNRYEGEGRGEGNENVVHPTHR